MKHLLVVIIIGLSQCCSAQSLLELSMNTSLGEYTPFGESVKLVSCNRSSSDSEHRMDSLKHVVNRLELELQELTNDTLLMDSVSYQKLYTVNYNIRIEYDGEVNQQFCVTDRTHHVHKDELTTDSLAIGKTTEGLIQSFGNKYIIITDSYYYLGNCEKLGILKSYYLREGYVELQK